MKLTTYLINTLPTNDVERCIYSWQFSILPELCIFKMKDYEWENAEWEDFKWFTNRTNIIFQWLFWSFTIEINS